MAKDTKEKQQINFDKELNKALNSQERNARVGALWNKLQTRDHTKLITEGEKPAISSPEKEQLMRNNIALYTKANLAHNINSGVGVGVEKIVDNKFAEIPSKISSKEAKVIEFSSKALDELSKVDQRDSRNNPRLYNKVDSYLKQIDNIDKPGLLKKAAIAAGNIGSDLIKKLGNRLPSLPTRNNTSKGKGTGNSI